MHVQGVKPELLAPAGDWDCLRAAVANGADAVYFGLPRFNARLRADNFKEEELPEIMSYLHRRGVKGYVTMNTLVFTDELQDAESYLRVLDAAAVDALIVQDVGLVRLSRQVAPGLAVHASTQMTITSPEGARLVEALGVERIVLARELSLREIQRFADTLPLEVFVHGALCVAYSGQCLTSESLGQRSANRGECAQACRMPYELVVDGVTRPLGDRRYLLSPQDLAAAAEIPSLIEQGVVSFKIEGRLKSPEYVAAVTQVYRRAIDDALAQRPAKLSAAERYQLQMTFSRGFHSGWLHGVNHQKLVPARFGKKRGAYLGRVAAVAKDYVELAEDAAVAPGDGVVFDTGGDTNAEQGGRVYAVRGRRLFFKHDHLDCNGIRPGHRVWKTSDPALARQLRHSYAASVPVKKIAADGLVRGAAGEPMQLELRAQGCVVSCSSTLVLQAARTAPLTPEKLRAHLERMGESPFQLGQLRWELEGDVILPLSAINQLRREAAAALERAVRPLRPAANGALQNMLASISQHPRKVDPCELTILCRSDAQLLAALECGERNLMVDYEDIRRYRHAVELVRSVAGARILLATPRIQKSGESGFFRLIANAQPDGVLIRNLGGLHFFKHEPLEKIGDFSLNIANPLAAEFFIDAGLHRVTVSYDLNVQQVLAMVAKCPPHWFELTLHQHMPMFHMEHCVFAAFLSDGTDHTNCGRPCDRHRVQLRDRVGVEHPLRADVGCRNTLFNAAAQTGADYFQEFHRSGLRRFRVELLEEDAAQTRSVIAAYRRLLNGEAGGQELTRLLHAKSQLGVTRGTYEPAGKP